MSNAQPPIKIDLLNQIRPVLRRERCRRVVMSLAFTWILVALVGLIVFAFNRSAQSALDPFLPSAWIWIAGLGGVGTLVAILFSLFSMPNAESMAHRIEEGFPELDSVLLTAIEQQPDQEEGLSFFQYDVIQKAIHHSFQEKWASVVPGWKIFSSSFGAITGLVGIVAAGLMLFLMPPPEFDSSIHMFSDIEKPVELDLSCSVQPGNTEIERGTNLLVLAEFANDSPPEAELHFTKQAGGDSEERVVSMTRSLDDPVFATRIMQVDQPLTYRVEFADETSQEYTVSVFDFPRMLRTDVELSYPKYTNLPNKVLQDTRRFSAVVGTDAKLRFNLNKEVTSATLRPEGEGGESLQLSQNGENPLLWETDLVIERSAKYRLHLLDAQQRENKSPPRLTIKALENQPPELKLLEPARDLAVSALEEVSMSASVWDDFGIAKTGLAWSIGGGDIRELELANNQSGKQKHVVDHLLELESLNAEPDQLVAWHFWAEDIGPDGESRRTESDMFFAEVRRFEEIFFQAQGQQGQQQQQQQQQGQQGPSAEQAMELAELQKEIINAVWRVIRREKGPSLSDAFDSDVELLAESQRSAITQVDELAEELNDELAKSLVDELKSFMNDSVDKLQSARQEPAAAPLTKAIRSQQSAWQTLLKMRAREVQVQQSQQQQQQSSSSSSSQASRQRQLQQMELTEQEDRYEQERLAQEESEQAQEQRENRQILSRLKELAQRQNDLNKRVKELQSALEEAETEQEKEELEKQLKRLEEEQQQVLRDTDELQERMEDSQSQQSQTEQMEQLQQARENVQRSSEALQEGDLSKAATEGTRAERELKDLRDEFQEKTAGQFNDQMRQMRNQAQDLENEQKELAQQVKDEEQNSQEGNRLDGEDKRQQLVDGIKKGQQEVEQLREEIKQTIEEADELEPLLADELYETYRETEQSRPDRALQYSADAVERGFDDDAKIVHDVAMKGIEELREGIDRAAERVLGDETEALKAARDTIKNLSRELDDEIERNDPRAESESAEQGSERGQGQGDRNQPDGEDSEANQRRGERGEGDSEGQQPGEQQRGEAQPGQPSQGEQNSDNPGQGSGQSESGGEENENGERPENGNEENPEGQEGAEPQNGRGQGQPGGGSPDGNRQAANRGGNRLDSEPNEGNRLGGIAGPTDARNFAPITGDDFREWSDRLRDVEEMIADPDLRADAARIRDQAKAIRKDLQRHSPEPDWEKIKMELAEPLAELQSRVTQEILRRDPKNALVPLNREPVPTRYESAVRKYYETLGTGQ
ncbi:DUF4175 family protein [Mariniblastus fucicola]|uniref:Uncharacterized protein n=1 Tax=Mariniblastus fucicola TaxID=980251 RepID=A0A5B9PB82_9BACT|nr:DUF4175 family protein [Mariniblastus fucicola]QEG23598.1 hypothetical protein MFFC18_34990 [Mariniblastus fucicola]